MRIKWRKITSSEASAGERMLICEAEDLARRRAIEDEILEKGGAEGVVVPHLPGLVVSHSQLRWGRGGGKIYLDVTVRLNNGAVRRYKWRSARPT